MADYEKAGFPLGERIIDAIEAESAGVDTLTVLSTLAFIAASICAHTDLPADHAATHTIAELKRHVDAFAAVDQVKRATAAPSALSSAEERDLMAGETLAKRLL